MDSCQRYRLEESTGTKGAQRSDGDPREGRGCVANQPRPLRPSWGGYLASKPEGPAPSVGAAAVRGGGGGCMPSPLSLLCCRGGGGGCRARDLYVTPSRAVVVGRTQDPPSTTSPPPPALLAPLSPQFLTDSRGVVCIGAGPAPAPPPPGVRCPSQVYAPPLVH